MAIQIVQGENYRLRIRVSDKKSCKPWNFSGFQGATASFPNVSGTGAYSVTGFNSETNVLEFDLQPADTNSILAGDSMDFQYQWMQGGELFIEIVQGQLSILGQLFGL
jgi:hypothetical protein